MTHIAIIESPTAGRLLLQKARARGWRVSLIRSPKGGIYASDIPPSISDIDVYDADPSNFPQLLEVCKKLHQKRPLHTVLSTLEYCVEHVAQVNEQLGILGCGVQAVKKARDKYRSKCDLQTDGVITMAVGTADKLAEIPKIAKEVGFPCVIKPRRGAASIGAFICHNWQDLMQHLAAAADLAKRIPEGAQSAVSAAWQIEEYLSGPMYSVEVAAARSEFQTLAIGERWRDGANEVLEVGTVYPANIDAKDFQRIDAFAKQVVQTLGLDLGIFHLEVVLTDMGPQLIECNPRLMGGSLPHLFSMAYRDHAYDLLLDVCVQQSLPEPQTAKRLAMSCLFGFKQEGIMPSVDVKDLLHKFSSLDFAIQWFVQPGTKVQALTTNHDYIGAFRFVQPLGYFSQAKQQRQQMLFKLAHRLDQDLVG